MGITFITNGNNMILSRSRITFAILTVLGANAFAQSEDDVIMAQQSAAIEQARRNVLVWTCTCVNGVPVFGFKTVGQMEDESNAKVAQEQALSRKLEQSATYQVAGVNYPVPHDETARKKLAFQLVNECKRS
jgi:signal transduction histidine kinase